LVQFNFKTQISLTELFARETTSESCYICGLFQPHLKIKLVHCIAN